MSATTGAALEGIKVLDLSSVLMGPLAAQMLGDMGADVIKIEAPEGDLARTVGPTRSPGMASLFLAANRNKRSMVLDLKQAEGQAVLQRLVKSCDVVLHSVRTASLDRMGLSYTSLAKHNPAIVYCHLKGFSDGGLYAGQPAFDDVIQALSGTASLQSAISGSPRFVPVFLADKVCAVYAANAVSVALLHKFRTGRGQSIDFSMFETMTAFNMIEHLWGETFAPPIGTMGYPSLRSGTRRPHPTKDGFISLWPVTDAQWRRFFGMIGRPELGDDPRLGSVTARIAEPEVVLALFNEVLPTRTSSEWLELCALEDLPAANVNTLEDLLGDRHLLSVNFWKTALHPSEGMLRMIPNTLLLSETPPSARRHAPLLGEHTLEVLREYAYSDEDIGRLLAMGVAQVPPRSGNEGLKA